jgi:acid phosphatase (class A)
MMTTRRNWLAAIALLAVLVGSSIAWRGHQRGALHFLDGDTSGYIALFPPPPARGSDTERSELDTLLDLQRTRSAAEVTAAQVDRKAEVIRFAAALGTDEATLGNVHTLTRLSQEVEDDAHPYVSDAKKHFGRPRPATIEPRLQPCLYNVTDPSYPSGHSNYGYLMAYLLSDLVPERRAELMARAAQFARQRMVCGVHFPSDIEAGRIGAGWLIDSLRRNPQFVNEEHAAAAELRATLKLPATPAR